MISKTSNPAFSESAFGNVFSAYSEDRMTLKGTVNKSLTLLAIIFASALITWKMAFAGNASVSVLMIAGLIVGTICSFVVIFSQKRAKIFSIIYAIGEGLALGGISAMYEMSIMASETQTSGIVLNAILLTMALFAVMLYLYKNHVIEASEKFTKILIAATAAIAIVYLIDFIMSLFGSNIGFIHSSGPVGIIVSLIIIAIAALNFILDFKNVENAIAQGAPEYMEWYCAFGLMLTLVWLYLEVLRLLAKLNRD